MSALPAIATPYIHSSIKRRKNTWYSIADGNWTDMNIWMSNSFRRYNYPQAGDDVYVNHNVVGNVTTTVNNLRISGKLTFANTISISVTGDIQATGTVDMTGANSILYLYGTNNYITTFVSGASGTVRYAATMRQGIMDLIYLNLYTTGIGAKYFTANATVAGTLITESNTEIGLYDLSVSGTTTVRNGSTLSKSGSGNLLFVGLVTVTNTVNTFIDFSVGNPSVELRGGITCATNQASSNVKTGTGTWTFTTNNQSITPGNSASITFMGNVIISGNITVTAVNGLGVNGVFTQFNGSVNGTTSLSTLKNAGAIYLGAASPVVMTTGIFDYYYTGTTVGYVMNASYSIPLTSFYALVIGGTGTKTLTGNTTLSTNLTLLASAILDCSTFDLNIAGTSTISSGGKLSKTGAGNILFTGLLSMTNGNIDFSGGNPTVEFRGGISGGGTMSVSTGTGQWKFSTNNQVIINYPTSYNSPILISGAITVTVSSVAISTINNTLNGDNAASIFDNRGKINYTNATAPMVTGKLYCNQAANKWSYYAAGNQDIRVPSDPIPGYYNLSLDTSGAKKLLGNVSVKGTYATSGTATLDSNGFSLTNP